MNYTGLKVVHIHFILNGHFMFHKCTEEVPTRIAKAVLNFQLPTVSEPWTLRL